MERINPEEKILFYKKYQGNVFLQLTHWQNPLGHYIKLFMVEKSIILQIMELYKDIT